MIDREQAIKAVLEATGQQNGYAQRAADAILALPDPVHEAAREVIEARSRDRGFGTGRGLHEALDRLRAALSAERVPTPIESEQK